MAWDKCPLYCTVLYCTVLYCTVLYCTVLYCTVLYCTVLYCTVLYCTTNNLIYYILCNCSRPKDYVGSALNIKKRWSKHKSDCRKEIWENCGLTRHFQQEHQGNMEEAISNLKITLVDHLEGVHSEERLLQLEKDWILNLGTSGPTGMNSRNQLLTNQRRNWGS